MARRLGPLRLRPPYLRFVALSLTDAVWFAFLGHSFAGDPGALGTQVTPALAAAIAGHGANFTFRTHWNAFFMPLAAGDAARARGGQPFFPGSFSYHWHNRYRLGLPPGSWAEILAQRFAAEAGEKAAVCGGSAAAGLS